MRNPLILYQTVEYRNNETLRLCKVTKEGVNHVYLKNSHWNEAMEIVLLLEGKAKHYIDGECIEAEVGRPIVINSECIHSLTIEGASDNTCALILSLPQNFLEAFFPEYRTMVFRNIPDSDCHPCQELMVELANYSYDEHKPCDRLYVQGHLMLLLYYLSRDSVSSAEVAVAGQRKDATRLKEILSYIDENFREPLKQEMVASQFYFSPQYFSRYFRKCTGMTFTQYLASRRVHAARKELLQTKNLVMDIAMRSGFPDERSFIDSFKRLYGVTPAQYRKNALRNVPPSVRTQKATGLQEA